MLNQRQRPIFLAVIALVAVWMLALAGYEIALHAKVTPEKIRAYVSSVDFNSLSPAEREAAIKKLAAMLNALSLEERRKLRLERLKWFNEMTEAEKAEFLAATLPTGFKQMISAFEDLPPDKRQRVVDQAVRQMKDADEQSPSPDNQGPVLSPELQQQVAKIGLQSFYSESSAQTKAELAPLMEEMQHMMESGRPMRGPGQQ
jgi:hypothetical protein